MTGRRPLFLVVGVLLIIAATWLLLLVNASTHKTLDERVLEVGAQLRCPICQGESVADSPSFLAKEMRQVIREQLGEGKSEQKVIQYFIRRYGSQIAWSPPWQGFSLLAWLVPIVLLLAGVGLLVMIVLNWRTSAVHILPSSPRTFPGSPRNLLRQQLVRTAPAAIDEEEKEFASFNEAELAQYRAVFEQELAADDPLFARYHTEAQ
jgi:cytochrome c-type biogenesis protein CcmH